MYYSSLLDSRFARDRARGSLCAGEDLWWRGVDALRRLLEDSAPVVTTQGDVRVIAEVRASALEALQAIYRDQRRRPDFGPVLVRPPMPAEEALASVAALAPEVQSSVAERVDAILRNRVLPPPEDEAELRAYVTLQELGQIGYRSEQVDAVSYMTPLQEEALRQRTSETRPRPYLRIADATDASRTFGYIYRMGRWTIDFGAGAGAADAAELIRALLEVRGPIPRLVLDESGSALRSETGPTTGAFAPVSEDVRDILVCMRAYLERSYHVVLAE